MFQKDQNIKVNIKKTVTRNLFGIKTYPSL